MAPTQRGDADGDEGPLEADEHGPQVTSRPDPTKGSTAAHPHESTKPRAPNSCPAWGEMRRQTSRLGCRAPLKTNPIRHKLHRWMLAWEGAATVRARPNPTTGTSAYPGEGWHQPAESHVKHSPNAKSPVLHTTSTARVALKTSSDNSDKRPRSALMPRLPKRCPRKHRIMP